MEKWLTAYDENAPPTLTSLKSSQWNGTKVKVRTAGKKLGKTVREFKYGNGWIRPRNAEHDPWTI
tara:strand:- start:273 stop:467 length:195 start_codon:yes stop_codon:yes gene_type:complete